MTFLLLLFRAKLPWLGRLVKLPIMNFWLVFGFWSNFNVVTICIAGLKLGESFVVRAIIEEFDLVRSFIVKAILEKSGLRKSFIVRVIIKKYCNLEYVSWIK